MPNDLYYFYESDFAKGNLVDFYNSLPSKKLQDMFVASMGGMSILDRDITNVLQGYEGPNPNGVTGKDSKKLEASSGLQEVKYWFGVSKHINWVPIIGWIVYAEARAFGDTNWHSLYFDSNTGECLSHSKNIAASKLYEKGIELLNNGKFSEAKNYFSNAYTHSSNKVDYDKFANARDAMDLAIEAQALLNTGKFSEAMLKFQAAYDKSTVSEIKNAFKAQENKYKNQQADLLDKEGNELHKQGRYQEAYDKFSKAYNMCTNGYSEEARFKSNRDIAKNNWDNDVKKQYEQKAQNLNSEGCKLDNQGKHEEALRKFKEATDTTNNPSSKNLYIKNQAIELVKIASNLKNNGDYQAAALKYDEAFKLNQDVTNFTAEYNTIGERLLDLGKYQEAIKYYDKVIQLDSQNSMGYDNKGFALYLLGKHQEAINYYNKAIQIQSDFLCYAKKGNALKSLGRIKEAEECFNKAISLMEKIKLDNNRYVENSNVIVLNKAEVQLVKELVSYQAEVENKVKNNEAEALNKQGIELLNQSKYNEAAEKFSAAYNKCTSGYSSEQKFKDNIDKAKVEVDAINLNNEGDRLFNQGKYVEAQSKYQEAYNKSSISKEYNRYSANRDKAQNKVNEVESINLNKQGDTLFNQGKYSEAYDKYNQAYSKYNSSQYSSNRDKAKTEVDAINLNSQGDTLFNQGKYVEAQGKYQEAYNKSKVNSNKYSVNINKAKAKIEEIKKDNVIKEFDMMFRSNTIDICKIKILQQTLNTMLEKGYGNDSAIVHRFHAVSLRIAKEEMRTSLIKVTDREDAIHLRSAIMNLIESEIEVLKQLNITDSNLVQELQILEEELNALEEDNVNILVDIQSINLKAEVAYKKVESLVNEKLAQDTQLEYGGQAVKLRNPLIAPILETYLMRGMNELLQLRISVVETSSKKQIKLIPSKAVDTQVDSINLHDIAQLLVNETSKNEITIIPLLTIASDTSTNNGVNHWVGLISEYTDNGVIVSYLDSENSSIKGLNNIILETFRAINPNHKITFREIAVEQQRYNNCGAELIENVMLYITGSRINQEDAIHLHSLLWEQSLILATIDDPQGKDTISKSAFTTLPSKSTITACYSSEPIISYDDLINQTITECTSLIGSIQCDMEN